MHQCITLIIFKFKSRYYLIIKIVIKFIVLSSIPTSLWNMDVFIVFFFIVKVVVIVVVYGVLLLLLLLLLMLLFFFLKQILTLVLSFWRRLIGSGMRTVSCYIYCYCWRCFVGGFCVVVVVVVVVAVGVLYLCLRVNRQLSYIYVSDRTWTFYI